MATVLVVDDRATNRELLRTVLGYRGHRVIEAHEGAEALVLAHAQHPDLVVTDLLMPGMDGYELAQEMRAAPDTAATPIVFYTANYLESETRPFAEACGVAHVLDKASDPQVLLAAVDDLLGEEHGRTIRVDDAEAYRAHLRAVSNKLVERSRALSDIEARFRVMADSSPVGIVFGDRHGSATYVNTRLTDIIGLPAEGLLGLGWLRSLGEEHHDDVLATVRSHTSRDIQHRYRTQATLPDGSLRWLNINVQTVRDDDAEPSGFVATVDDVTEVVEAEQRRRAAERHHDVEEQIRATERLESLSRLAGGVAHDFNNILGAILSFRTFVAEAIEELTSAGRLDQPTGHALLSDLGQIRTAGQRAAGLTNQLMTFGSRKVINRTAVDLNQAVRESNDMLTPTLGAHIDVVTRLAADLYPVLAEPISLAQVLLNLTLNARDAMPAGGTLTVTTSNAHNGNDPTASGSMECCDRVRLCVRDTGTGMTPEVRQRAIEPFFTTKGHGQGTGLGLATVYGIVNQLGGDIHIESAPGRGTAISIDLPTTDQPIDPESPAIRPAGGGTETILVAEDEQPIREAVTRTLTKAGYTVLAASSGVDALHCADNHPGAIALLLSDVMMPGMLGNELAEQLRQRRPDAKVLFMSGYAGDLMNEQGVLEPDVTALSKPFTENELLTAVQTMLHAAGR